MYSKKETDFSFADRAAGYDEGMEGRIARKFYEESDNEQKNT